MKKILCLSAAAALVATLAIGAGAADGKNIVLTASDDTLAAGETFTITITAENFEEFNTAMFYDVEYNEEYLEWTGGSWQLGEGTLSDYVIESGGNDNRSGVYYTENAVSGTQALATLEFTVLKECEEAQTIGCSVILKNNDVDYGSAELETEVDVSGEEEPAVTYTYGQNAQIRLIEPWGLKVNTKISVDGTVVNYDSLYDYGVYFIRASELDTEGLTQDTITPEDILNDSDAVLITKADGVTVEGQYLSAIYDKGLYTYEFSDSVFVMYYFVTENGKSPVYAPIRERNISDLVNSRMEDSKFSEKERAVYRYMSDLEKNIIDYRADFTDLSKPVMQEIPTLGEYSISGNVIETSYTFGHNVQVKLIEPWGMRLNGKVSVNGSVINYDSMQEYGVIVHVDADADGYTVNELLEQKDAYVFSSRNADVVINSGYITADYFKDIYTYQLNTNVYVMYYVVDSTGNVHCGPVKVRNLYEIMKERIDGTNATAKEKAVYVSMVGLYDTVTDYRSDFDN